MISIQMILQLNYYLNHDGNVPYRFEKRLKEVIKGLSFEERTSILKRIDNAKRFDIYALISGLNKENYEELMNNESVSDEVKDEIFKFKIINLTKEEKIEL